MSVPEPRRSKDLLPSDFKILLDAPEDGCAEEWCWVPVAFAATVEDAIGLAIEQGAIDEGDGLKLIPAGKTWMRRDPAFQEAEYGWHNASEDLRLDYEPWLPCSKWAKTGIEVWVLEVTDDA